MLGIQGVYYTSAFDQVAQSSPDLTKWHPKAPGMTPPDTFEDRKEAVSFGNSYDRKLKYDEKIAAIEDLKGDEKDDTVAYCVCIKSVNNGDNKLVMLDDEQAKESLNNVMVQQSVMEDNFKMKEEIRKYKELCMKQRNEISEQKQRLDSNLLKISQQLLVLQKSLQRKEKTFSRILRRKDKTISRQQELINDLLEKNVETVGENTGHEDSDSGVVVSEAEVSMMRINRSVSGVIKYGGTRENKLYQRYLKSSKSEKNENAVLEYPNDPIIISLEQRTTPSEPKTSDPSKRVFLNHRSVTRLKDIKYKRISKTKSKSMEELRDKLRDSPFTDRETSRYSHA